MHASVHVCPFIYKCVLGYRWMWRSEDNLRNCCSVFIHFFWNRTSHWPTCSQSVGQWSEQESGLLSLPRQSWDYKHVPLYSDLFIDSGNRIQDLKVVWPKVCWLLWLKLIAISDRILNHQGYKSSGTAVTDSLDWASLWPCLQGTMLIK